MYPCFKGSAPVLKELLTRVAGAVLHKSAWRSGKGGLGPCALSSLKPVSQSSACRPPEQGSCPSPERTLLPAQSSLTHCLSIFVSKTLHPRWGLNSGPHSEDSEPARRPCLSVSTQGLASSMREPDTGPWAGVEGRTFSSAGGDPASVSPATVHLSPRPDGAPKCGGQEKGGAGRAACTGSGAQGSGRTPGVSLSSTLLWGNHERSPPGSGQESAVPVHWVPVM